MAERLTAFAPVAPPGARVLVLVNLSSTPQDRRANLVIHERIGQVFAELP